MKLKLSDILLLTLFFVMGSMIFAIKKMQEVNGPVEQAVPVPALKPTPLPQAQAQLPKLRLEMSTPEKAGSYGRLSLDEFLAKGSPSIDIRDVTPKASAQQMPAENLMQPARPKNSVIKRPRKKKDDRARLNTTPTFSLGAPPIETAEAVNLPYFPEMDNLRFTDRVVEMAEASPIQPDSRGCGTLNNSLKTTPKHSKVRSVGMERQLTGRTSIGVEYVYKDGCYKKAVAAFQSSDMPGDNGVNLRVNMRF